MPNVFGQTKRHLKRAQLLCTHITDHLSPVHDNYESDHPEFVERVYIAARFARELHEYIQKLYDEFVTL